MIGLQILPNRFGGWLVIADGQLIASFLTKDKAMHYAREVGQ
ncbi:hypothetical protein [Mariprofundus erugo]|nr:hypothetical protein [Mariprofundus erugo]